jgi:Zn-dependent M16 (insulinase) family peptidase
MDTSELDEKLRNYLELYVECLFNCPIEKKDVKLTHEQVVELLNDETVSYSNGIGLSGENFVCGTFAQLTLFEMKFDSQNFEKGIEWVHDILWNTKFDVERLKISTVKLINDVSNYKRNAKSISRAAIKYLNFDTKKSNHNVLNYSRQHDFLTELVTRLDKEPESVIKEMNEMRDFITNPERIRLNIITNFYEKKNVKKLLLEKFLNSKTIYKPKPFFYSKDLLTNQKQSKDGFIFGISSTDSSNLYQTAVGISSYDDKDIASLEVVIEYLTGLEGPFWKKIRGLGLSYSYSINTSIEQGLTYFVLQKSTSLTKAYFEAKKIVDEFLEGKEIFDDIMLESAKSAVIFGIISREETLYEAANQQFNNYLKNLPSNGNQILLQNIAKVTKEDLLVALKKYVAKIFDTSSSLSVITTNTQKLSDIQEEFKDVRKFNEVENFFTK